MGFMRVVAGGRIFIHFFALRHSKWKMMKKIPFWRWNETRNPFVGCFDFVELNKTQRELFMNIQQTMCAFEIAFEMKINKRNELKYVESLRSACHRCLMRTHICTEDRSQPYCYESWDYQFSWLVSFNYIFGKNFFIKIGKTFFYY